ncbi:MAG TPA: response regulator [Burkholderiales bacterium]|nr:response regulator [Burkholderiales bacterium]
MQIYIVEDSAAVRTRLTAMLGEVPGAEVAGASAGATQATREILESRPEVVILDLNLAEGGGFDVLRALRAEAPEIDVFMLSNFSAYPYRQLAERLGARGFFDKTTEFGRVREALAAKAKESTCKPSSN